MQAFLDGSDTFASPSRRQHEPEAPWRSQATAAGWKVFLEENVYLASPVRPEHQRKPLYDNVYIESPVRPEYQPKPLWGTPTTHVVNDGGKGIAIAPDGGTDGGDGTATAPDGGDDGGGDGTGGDVAPTTGGRQHEARRSGINGGRNRYGTSGGKNKAYYHAYYAAKGKGKAAVVAFKRTYGKPPSSGGEA